MIEIKIEKGIPIPTITKKYRLSYPFQYMKVGDSFLVPQDYAEIARCSSQQFGKRHNMKFIMKTLEGYSRIWRIK